jgi:hypothetical protein
MLTFDSAPAIETSRVLASRILPICGNVKSAVLSPMLTRSLM